MMVIEWFQPAGRAYEWFGPTSDTIALVQAGGASAVASVIGERGEPGADGADGADGVGVAIGGTIGQVLAKASATDYDTEWIDQTGGGADAPTFSGSFTALIDQPVDTVVESNTITATGIDTWVWPIVARNADVQVNAQPYDANSAIRTGDEITLRMTTPALGDQTINAAIYGQGFTLGWSVTTTLSVFSPADLFAAGEVGAWYDPSDLTTLFQDAAGTVPVTTAGQPVARINDKSGNGFHATQATAAARPILRQVGSLYCLEFDGVGDYLVASYGSDLANLTRAVGYRVLGQNFIADDDGQVNYASIVALADGDLRWGINGAGAGNALLASGGWDWGVDSVAVVSAHADRAFRITGSGNAASGISATAPAGLSGATIGAGAGGIISLQGRIYSFVDVGRVLTEEERTNLADYIAEKSGVTL